MHAQQQLRSMTVALALGVGLLAAPVQAQEAAGSNRNVKDHLNCYEVENANSNHSPNVAPETKSVWLKTDFSREFCKVEVEPDLFCTGASKTPDHADGRFGGVRVGDFLCHEITHCNGQGGRGQEITVKDQFGPRPHHRFKLKLKKAELLCAPAERQRGH